MEAVRKLNEVAELTVKAVVSGVALGVVFGAANAYLGLRVGMTVSTSIPAAVMAVAIFKLLKSRGTILEANMAQTIGSASTALATGTIFTIPALFLWGMAPPFLQVAILCFLGGVLGVAAMIPLRKLLIIDAHDELPYPEGKACAQVLKATASSSSTSKWIFRGMGVGAIAKIIVSLFFLVPGAFGFSIPIIPKAELWLEMAPALLGVGFILGYQQSAIVIAGSLLSSLVLIPMIALVGQTLGQPLAPETTRLVSAMTADEIWSTYIRYIGAGAVATAGILTVLGGLPTMFGAFAGVVRGMKKGPNSGAPLANTERDLPGPFVIGAVVLVIAVSFIPGVFGGNMPFMARLVCSLGVAVFGVLFVAVAARIVGIVGVSSNPVSGVTLVTLLAVASLFVLFGWDDAGARAAVLTVGTIVCVAASKAGDIAQDLKTGYLVGATPARQQFGQLVGASVACWAVAGTVLLLGSVYTFGSKEIPAPQATLMKTIIEGVLSGNIPWNLVLTGVGITLNGMLCGVSGLAYAIGVYLPLSSMAPIFVGGVVRLLVDRKARKKVETDSDPGILAASGLVAGEGLAGVLIAGLVALGLAPKNMNPIFGGVGGQLLAVLLLFVTCYFLYRAGKTEDEIVA